MSNVVSREQYFKYGLEILADSGFKGLGINVLCRHFGVTSGSFYHHFGNMRGYVDALLAFWEDRQVVILRDMAFGAGEPEADIEKLRDLTLNLHHDAEAAIRAWGANDESVGAVLKRVDDARRKTVQKAILGVVGDRKIAKALTSLGMSMLVGYQQLSLAGHRDDLGVLLDEFIRLIHSHSAIRQSF
ncbi:TetR/AcrR family transcriptional regulator [Mycolicibacterium phocaicum]|uniref:TetR/AcrR family transcriptional regulator n=1 Tax=Mycolicibacterium phocaicum TaxID=319706 RepID=UPI000928B0EA|nr:TetR/AcrR family transcriptional regulator [Mycolicibacterium phocaicum]UCZ62492.1 TetR/AcrR family transcriptional regulator [Mycolicibacterium phocaicum]SHT67918.1 TetR family transcriptional regulator [Mycobacteroides abscessus subsp. abscessus]